MRRRYGLVAVALFAVPIVAVPAFASDPSTNKARFSPLSPRVPAGATRLGRLSPSRPLAITVVLQPAHEDRLDRLLRDLYDPASPRYGQWLATGEFAREYGPSADDMWDMRRN